MSSLFNDLEIKLEPIDFEELGLEKLITTEAPTNHNTALNMQSVLSISQQRLEQENCHNLTIFDYSTNERTKAWMDDMLEFTSNLARQIQDVLELIKSDFVKKNMKFNTDFRNHFLYCINNRSMEAYDSFLIGLSQEMKSDDSSVNKPLTYVLKPHNQCDKNQRQSVNLLSKRPASDDVLQTKYPRLDGTTTMVTTNGQVVQSNNLLKVGSEVIVKKVTSEMMTSVSKITTTPTKTKPFINLRRVDEIQKSQQLNKTLEKAKNRLGLTDKNKAIQRRKSTGTSLMQVSAKDRDGMVITLKKVTSLDDAKKAQPKKNGPKKVIGRRKTVGAKELMASNKMMNIEKGQTQTQTQTNKLSVTIPSKKEAVSGRMVTRSFRRSESSRKPTPIHRCDKCNYTTEVNANLQRHLLMHTGERPFKCKYCSKTCTQKVNLISHMQSSHPLVDVLDC